MALANIGASELYFIILVDHITEVRYQEVLLIVQTDGNDIRRLQEIAKEPNPELHSCGNEIYLFCFYCSLCTHLRFVGLSLHIRSSTIFS